MLQIAIYLTNMFRDLANLIIIDITNLGNDPANLEELNSKFWASRAERQNKGWPWQLYLNYDGPGSSPRQTRFEYKRTLRLK